MVNQELNQQITILTEAEKELSAFIEANDSKSVDTSNVESYLEGENAKS